MDMPGLIYFVYKNDDPLYNEDCQFKDNSMYCGFDHFDSPFYQTWISVNISIFIGNREENEIWTYRR